MCLSGFPIFLFAIFSCSSLFESACAVRQLPRSVKFDWIAFASHWVFVFISDGFKLQGVHRSCSLVVGLCRIGAASRQAESRLPWTTSWWIGSPNFLASSVFLDFLLYRVSPDVSEPCFHEFSASRPWLWSPRSHPRTFEQTLGPGLFLHFKQACRSFHVSSPRFFRVINSSDFLENRG